MAGYANVSFSRFSATDSSHVKQEKSLRSVIKYINYNDLVVECCLYKTETWYTQLTYLVSPRRANVVYLAERTEPRV